MGTKPRVAEANLFGDPGVHVRFREPDTLEATHPYKIHHHPSQTINVEVTDQDSTPVEGACVSLHQPGCEGLFPKVCYTNPDGIATFDSVVACRPEDGWDTLLVTVTKPGYIPYLSSILIRKGCPYVFVWNGKEYVEGNNIIPPDTRDTADGDGVDYYRYRVWGT